MGEKHLRLLKYTKRKMKGTEKHGKAVGCSSYRKPGLAVRWKRRAGRVYNQPAAAKGGSC